MLDSLVRVSRRVGWRTDRFATDHQRPALTRPNLPTQSERTASSASPVDRRQRDRGHGPRPFLDLETSRPGPAINFRRRHEAGADHLLGRLLTASKPVVALYSGKVHSPMALRNDRAGPFQDPCLNRPSPRHGKLNSPSRLMRIHPFASRRFHVLLNSLFKVLFNFPSRYLSAIGLVSVFSFRWSLPPTLGCILKQPDSKDAHSHDAECR